MNDEIIKHRRSEAFFGRRKSQKLSDQQQGIFENLLPELRVNTGSPSIKNLDEFFTHKPSQFRLEIGFGGGEHLAHQARSNPNIGYFGVEPFINSMVKLLSVIKDESLENIRLYDEDATELLDWLPENSLDRVDLLYPDPWPKKRHWKRRFVNQKNLTRISRVLKPDGVFHFASDIDTYINWTLNHCEMHAAFNWQAHGPNDWQEPYPDWIRTRYEAKAIRESRTPCYLRFKVNDG